MPHSYAGTARPHRKSHMNTSTTGTAPGSHMSTAEIKAHIATMFADDRHPTPAPARPPGQAPDPQVSR